MKIIKAKVLGYCMGVRRAVEIAGREAAGAGTSGVFTIGPLIHNPQVLESLRKKGVDVLNEDRVPDDLGGHTLIIRAHGISPDLETSLRNCGARLVDATCPKVHASQMKARSLSAEGCRIFLAGEQHHGEVIGIQGYAPDCIVVADPGEAGKAAEALRAEAPDTRCALLGQTTISRDEFEEIGNTLKEYFPGIKIIDTICGATRDRQEALRELCSAVDAVIIIGGKASSNTRRLLAIAEKLGKPAWLAETKDDLPPDIGKYGTVGLSAGASTPGYIIDEIEEALKKL
ncbi:4-hydroxy-3-methylbut-2-enyl diphosphate reductase [Breznakiella homolactica]|uniref:4-hydroxy-3-methylbut-2-enyl diphosphate reductase n=1 Tax=Breznakiella homolactica TaxID=2798577 RepID=A0A7T7XRQ6_9SPIR|nr:4-hydroxy-3-methylbut-2-enyl diphosphate reductase [Breznakiella homolactica]QQO11214.1 4-hydroxy-3-methylbut-2-enyl diphosphate reductase [Breznakiella homolactica]